METSKRKTKIGMGNNRLGKISCSKKNMEETEEKKVQEYRDKRTAKQARKDRIWGNAKGGRRKKKVHITRARTVSKISGKDPMSFSLFKQVIPLLQTRNS
jgi:hypothetical protein